MDRVDEAPDLNDYPTAEDPYGTQPAKGEFEEQEAAVRKLQDADPDGTKYPSYEVGQDPDDRSSGGSTDSNNTLTHANSGDETESLRVEPEGGEKDG